MTILYDSVVWTALVGATAALQAWLTQCGYWELAHLALAPVCINKMSLALSQALFLCGPDRAELPQSLPQPELFPRGTFTERLQRP